MRLPAVILACMVALFGSVPAASAVAAGTGVRGTVNLSWGNIGGSPITSWQGHANLSFDPTAGARSSVLAAAADPALGEGVRSMYAPQVQAAVVTSLESSRTEQVTCTSEDTDGNPMDVPATYSTTSAGIADGRVAFEILPPRVDLVTGRGSLQLEPYVQTNSNAGSTGWWLADRWVVPGRWNIAGTWPCAGAGAGEPAQRLPRIFAVNGDAAVPRAVSDRLAFVGQRSWPLRRQANGRWSVLVDFSRRETFSDSPFGAQDRQQLDIRSSSSLRLAGSMRALQARCRVPYGLIARARSASAAVRLARRAGLTATTYGGVRRSRYQRRAAFTITGRALDTMGHAPCGLGRYKVYRTIPA